MSDSSEIFSRVRSAVNIVDVVGEHVALKRAGREFKGLCPFHEDHRPSMAVVPHKQIFHCFVCGTGGDVFKFVMGYHKMSAGEALRMLAQRAGIKLPDLPGRGGGGGGPSRDKDGLTPRERISNANEWACGWFEKQLRLPQGRTGLTYLHSRGLTDETMAKFRLGFAPEGWTNLVNDALRTQNSALSTQHLLEAGLIKQRNDSSPYDAFRNRVIFPIIDATGGGGSGGAAAKQQGGRVIAFGGRILEEKRDEAGNVVEAKYLNSPDTKLFNKSESLYGINLARQHIIRTRTAIVVEGYMDVIACHQAGVSNVIATLGTALTPDHARILKNYAQTIVLVFDSDDAGRRAADRALEVFVRGTMDIKLTNVPDGKDPCDFCMKNGGEPFQKLVENATDALTYKWQQLQTQFHATDSLSARQEAITTFLRFVAAALDVDHTNAAAAIDPVRRGLLLTKIASLVNMPLTDLQQTLKNLARTNRPPPGPSQNPNVAQGSPLGVPVTPDDADLAQGEVAVPMLRVDVRSLKALALAEGWFLGALLTRPTMYDTVREQVSLSLFESFHALASALIEYFDNHAELAACTLAELAAHLEETQTAGGELVRQAIELESLAANWLEPANLSPMHAKMMLNLTADRGVTLESVAQDALRELQQARWGGSVDPAIAQEFDAPVEDATMPVGTDDAALKELHALVVRKANPSLRNTNFPA